MQAAEQLARLRYELEDVDRRIVEALGHRQELVDQIAAIKDESGVELRDPARERVVLRLVDAEARTHGVDPYFIVRLFRQIIDQSIRRQQSRLLQGALPDCARITVGYQGPEGGSDHEAALSHFSVRVGEVQYRAFESVREMLHAVHARMIDYAVMPIEHTATGSIKEAYDLLAEMNLALVGEEIQSSHVAFGDGSSTRFVVAAADSMECDRRIRTKTSVLFVTRHEKGALLACLNVFADHNLNLTKLESRPRPGATWEYQFYVDFEGNCADASVASALRELATRALYVRVFGSYPARTTAESAVADLTIEPATSETPAVTFIAAPTPTASGSPARPHLVARQTRADDTVIRVERAVFGGDRPVVIAGPCAVESWDQVLACARAARDAGADVLRGGVFKPRTSPYSFQGLGHDGLELLREAGRATGLPVVTEVLSPADLDVVARHVDILQIGARNMQNFALLKEIGRIDKPVILKRGLSASIDEWLAAAEHILAQGNQQVILCERGIRTFETATRNTLDLGAIPVVRERTHLPVIVDPSHAAGIARWVPPMAEAAIAAGAQGLMIEIHPSPADALSDGPQALTFPVFQQLMVRLRARTLAAA